MRPQTPDGPLVVYANHASWWDPILFMVLSRHLFPHRTAYGPMDSAALERYPIFKRLGVFGLERGSHRGAVEFVKTAEAILARDRSVLWLTAEGKFSDPRTRPVELQFGLAHLVRRIPALRALPMAVEYTFWNERLPEILVRPGSPVELPAVSRDDLGAINSLLEVALERELDALAAASCDRDPSLFRTLLLGRAGIGGVYDHWRRWRSLRTGQSISLSHEEERS